MKRKVKTKVKGFRTTDGAGVKLVRVLGNLTTKEFDPILMLDSFDSINPDDYTAGFPMHPHRGIETISYVSRGKMVHRDSLGNEAGISDGEVQWMNSGSGIMHEEMVPAAERLLGVQLWLNLPAKDKMSKPSYNSIKNEDIKEIEIEGGKIRLLAGKYGEHEGYKGDYLSMDYYDIHLNADAEVTLTMEEDDSVMVFTLLGDVYIDGEHIEEKTAVKLTEGDSLGNEAGISDGEVQWMNSGSGIMHEEMVPAAERLLGVQLWLNLPAKDKMSKPSYNSIKNEDIKEIEIEGGKIRLLAGKYGEHEGYKGDYLSMDYYDIHLNADAEVTLTMEEDDSVMVFTLLGDVYIDGEHIEEKTAVKLTEGDSLTIKNGNEKAQVLYMNSRALNEPVAWAGPIVMNTQEELQKAFLELRSNTFIKETAEY